MPRTRPPYPPEFRQEAVALVHRSSESIAQIAKDLGCSEQTLRSWVSQAAVNAGKKPGLTTEEREELARLRRRIRTLEEEREILRKAAAFFARESET